MLPSMPILFSRESQDSFGNKIESTANVFTQNIVNKPRDKQELQTFMNSDGTSKGPSKDIKEKDSSKKDESEKPKVNENQLEAALVRSYYTKVKSRFSNTPISINKFSQFRNILKSFDPGKETPIDLYRKVEELFGETHSDLVEEFLLFLKPGQAAQVGRFMDHFMLTQMTSFIELLQTTFARKPTVYRKILRAVTAGINNGSSQDMKSRVLPHLRSSPRLIQMFKSLFPDERPPDSLYETNTDVMNESCLECDNGCDVWEFEPDEKKKVDAKEGLDSTYLHGRVFLQHGKLLKPACVTYPYSKEPYRVHLRRLAPESSISPPDSEDERTSKRNKTQSKGPPKKSRKTKSPKPVKDVNDNTKKDLKQIQKKAEKKKNNYKRKDIKKKEDKKPKDAKTDAKSWTREEDKTMLEVLKGEGGSENVLSRVCALLPHRSKNEVKERFCHVMNLLQQMAVNKVM